MRNFQLLHEMSSLPQPPSNLRDPQEEEAEVQSLILVRLNPDAVPPPLLTDRPEAVKLLLRMHGSTKAWDWGAWD